MDDEIILIEDDFIPITSLQITENEENEIIEIAVSVMDVKLDPAGSHVLKGEKGKSAYESAVEFGFVGTETEWIASLKGEPGSSAEVAELPFRFVVADVVTDLEIGKPCVIWQRKSDGSDTMWVWDGVEG